MGKGFDHFRIVTEDVLSNDAPGLAQYDVLFLTCKAGGEAFRANLRDYVEKGGTLYASDWRFDAIKAAFPEFDGAKLRLHIQSPDGKSHTRDCTATVILDVPVAALGLWMYTITALELPFPNFPFTATASEKK